MVMSDPCDSFTNSLLAVVTASGIDSEPDEVDGEPGAFSTGGRAASTPAHLWSPQKDTAYEVLKRFTATEPSSVMEEVLSDKAAIESCFRIN